MRIATLIAVSVLSVAAVPAIAQDTMMSHDKMMKTSAADKRKMASCNAMAHDKMMKNAGCMKMMKMHPDMMKSDSGTMTH